MINPQDFTALRITILVRSDQGQTVDIKNHFNSIPFQYQMQDTLGDLIKSSLKTAEVDFAEVIISLDAPAENAKKINQTKKSSLLGRLFGKD